jgi:hypothetical protein
VEESLLRSASGSVISAESDPPQAAAKNSSPTATETKSGSLKWGLMTRSFKDVFGISIQRPRPQVRRPSSGVQDRAGLVYLSIKFTGQTGIRIYLNRYPWRSVLRLPYRSITITRKGGPTGAPEWLPELAVICCDKLWLSAMGPVLFQPAASFRRSS